MAIRYRARGRSRNVGFTLIELLVVIAIIALLMAILVPTLNKAGKQVRGTVCMASLKQWGRPASRPGATSGTRATVGRST